MPRREKDEPTVTTTETATPADVTAGGPTETPAEGDAAQQAPAPKADKPLGPMTTRTGAEALVIKAPKGQRVFTAGGDKGAKIKELLTTRPDMPRKEIAAMVGCSQSRVAEVARVLGISKSREETAATDGPPADAAAEDATAEAPASA